MPYVAIISPTDMLSSISLVKITANFVGLYRFHRSTFSVATSHHLYSRRIIPSPMCSLDATK